MNIEKAQEKLKEMKAKGLKPKRFDPIQKAKENKKSMRLAINAMCFDCMGRASTYVKDVRECTAPNCPIYHFRPFK